MVSFAVGSLSCREDSPPPSGWYVTVVVLKQLGAEPELVHCHVTLTLEAFMRLAVTSVGWEELGLDNKLSIHVMHQVAQNIL